VQVGSTATAFATIINGGTIPALVCELLPVTNVPATFTYQAADFTSPSLTSIASVSTPVSIAAGVAQSFIIAFTPTAPIAPTEVLIRFRCGGAAAGASEAPLIVGVNTLLLSASENPVADIVVLAATVTNDGVVGIFGTTGSQVFTIATANVGVQAAIAVSAEASVAALPVVITLCQTNPVTSACLATPSSTITTTIGASATPTFSIFVKAAGPVTFDAAANRIFVRFKDATNATRGSTSVAVRTQ
jgi:hypothetical protein